MTKLTTILTDQLENNLNENLFKDENMQQWFTGQDIKDDVTALQKPLRTTKLATAIKSWSACQTRLFFQQSTKLHGIWASSFTPSHHQRQSQNCKKTVPSVATLHVINARTC